MSIFKKNLEKNAVKKALNEIQINLENNYKDLAIKAYNDAAAPIICFSTGGRDFGALPGCCPSA